MTKWILGQPGGPAGPFYSVVSQTGEAIVLRSGSEKRARQIVKLGAILDCDFDTIQEAGKRLARILIRDGASSIIEDGLEDYVIRAVIEVLFAEEE